MRWRLYERRGSPFTCCFCCHVRTGTLLIGSFSLVVNVCSIVTTLLLLTNPASISKYGDTTSSDNVENIFDNDDDGLSTVATTTVTNNSVWTVLSNRVHGADTKVIDLIVNIGLAVATAGLLYGVLKGRPKFLLPYFCIQVFDFCVLALFIIGFFSYEPNIKKWLAAQKDFLLKDELMSLHNGWLVLIAGTIAVVCLWIKAYCINVVWSCYKFLIASSGPVHPPHNDNLPSVDGLFFHAGSATTIPCDEASSTVAVGMDSQVLLMPPKYEDILTMSSPASSTFPEVEGAQPPPSYNEVVVQLEPNTRSS